MRNRFLTFALYLFQNMSISVGEKEIYIAENLGTGWLEACVPISNYKFQQLVLSFGNGKSKGKGTLLDSVLF
jgi:hypothetical protein